MKKRILALALVIVSLVSVLTGCAYRYDKKDMSDYVTADYTAFEALLKSIDIKGADFGPYTENSPARDDKVLEKIDETLAGKIATGDAKVDGAYGFRQKIYYAFYCKTADGKIFETKNMDGAKLASLLSNPEYNAGNATEELALDSALLKEIFKAINGKATADYKYESETTGTMAAGDKVFVTYKYTYTDENGASKSVNSEYMLLEVAAKPGEGLNATSIAQLLDGKSLGKIEGTAEAPLKFTSTELGECVVDSMTVHFRIKAGQAIEVNYEATEDKSYTNAADTATAAKVEVKKGDVITYVVYPAYAQTVAELKAETVINKIYGESISTSSLKIFTENEAMEKLIAEVVKLKSAYDQANSKVTSAGTSATDAQKATRDEAKKKLDDAVAALPAQLLATSEDAEKLIMDAYKETVYDSLETAYDTEIRKQLGQKLWAAIEAGVKVDAENLPKSAVKEAKDRIIAGHKNTYYTGTYTDSSTNKSVAYTDTYKNFDEYLSAVAYKDKDVEATIDAEAKAEVVELIRVYAVAQKYSDNVARVTNADIASYADKLYPSLYYTFYLQGNYYPTVDDIIDLYGKTALRAALTFDRIMNYFLATEMVDKTTEHPNGHVKYTNLGTINYVG